ncbi:hypothetical protein EYF80_068017 [Liparis tanakae]|uniref:Uncharacterized protein n=1 Tax=Liparis tanakae TaxID=230148 RepID=A0A4Z2DZ83_9TELE|nr:hypothetical protein EYF80_068017 [Liparis tanakae]
MVSVAVVSNLASAAGWLVISQQPMLLVSKGSRAGVGRRSQQGGGTVPVPREELRGSGGRRRRLPAPHNKRHVYVTHEETHGNSL